jgi:hypothetical protein
MRVIGALAATLIFLVAAAVYSNFGTLSPCGVLRETVRQHDGLAAVLPDSIVDLILTGQYGALSPSHCLAILVNNSPNTPIPNAAQASPPQSAQPAPRPAPQFAPVVAQGSLQWAMKVTAQAADECRAKRLRGELPSYATSVQCANAPMLQAFNAVHYKYMDLIQYFSGKRLEFAAMIDRGELTEQQGQAEIQKVYAAIQATERRRDSRQMQ